LQSSESKPGQIAPVTSLRFVAALYVFIFHIHQHWPLVSESSAVSQLLSLGAVGMSLFFILSGFILAYRYRDGIPNTTKYYFDRFARIYPVYFVAAVVTIPFLIFSVQSSDGSQTIKIGRYLFLVFSNVFLVQAWFPSTFSFWNNGGSWSISVEAFFYVAFPIILYALHKRTTKTLLLAMALAYAASILPGFAFLTFPNPPPLPTYYAGPMFRIPEFLVGVLGGILYNRGHKIPSPNFSMAIGALAMALLLSFGPPLGYAYITLHIYSVPLLALIIFSAATIKNGLIYSILSIRPLVKLGEASYSFYAFQSLVISIFILNENSLSKYIPALNNPWVMATVIFSVLSIISFLSERILEQWVRKNMTKKYNASQKESATKIDQIGNCALGSSATNSSTAG